MTDVGNENDPLDILRRNRDAFDNQLSQGTTNEADLAGHYPYSPERFRVFVDGVRQQIQYDGEPAQYEDIVDGHLLKPQTAGEVVTLSTAERYRYVVQYILEASLAMQLNQELQTGEIVTVAYGDADLENATGETPGPSADGWILYHTGSDGPKEATYAEYRDGIERDSVTVHFEELFQNFGRLAMKLNWYNVGRSSLDETYTTDGQQFNEQQGAVSVDGAKGPQTANKQVQVSVKAEGGAGSLNAEVGSIGVRTLGSVTGLLRTKTFDFEAELTETGGFEPLLAVRVDPDRQLVNTQFSVLEPVDFSETDDLTLIAQIFSADNVLDVNGNPLTDSNYGTPAEVSAINSVIETSADVEQVVDQTGTPQVVMPDPGGYQVAYGSLTSTGPGGGSSRVSSRARTQKRAIPNGDVAVIMARARGDSTGTILADTQFEQDW